MHKLINMNQTRFQKIVNNPSHPFDYNIKGIVDECLQADSAEKLVPFRDNFNTISEKDYEWFKRSFMQVISLDKIAKKLDKAIVEHLTGSIREELAEQGQDIENIRSIAPWHMIIASLNSSIANLNAKLYMGCSRPESLLLKDSIIDKIQKKMDVISDMELQVASDMMPEYEDKKIVLNEETYAYELV